MPTLIRRNGGALHASMLTFFFSFFFPTGESVIQSIRERQPAYNLITNNCQTYALQLLDAIKVGSKKEFGTTLAVYERLKANGNVKDLFVDPQGPEARPEDGASLHEGTVSFANQVMHDNTTQLDVKEEMARGNEHAEGVGNGADKCADRGGSECKKEKQSTTKRFFYCFMKK